MVKLITPRGRGRPDYTSEVSRSVVGTPKRGQQGYWANAKFFIPGYSYVQLTIGQGFSVNYEYVPEGQQFVLERVEVTSSKPSSTLLILDVYVENQQGNLSFIGGTKGLGRAVVEVGRARVFSAGERPVYFVNNLSPGMAHVTLNIFGFTEPAEVTTL